MISFTIITCTYNAADCLKPTLDSVLCQTHKAVEHIIMDGASTDHTVQMAFDYAATNQAKHTGHTVRIKSEKDGGLYFAMNKAIALAQNQYILFLNAGDRLPATDTLQRIAQLVDEQHLPGVIYGLTDIVDDKGHFMRHRRLQPPAKLTWRAFRHGMLVCHQAFYARTDVAKNIAYDTQYRFSADVDWCIRIMKRCEEQQLTLMPTGFTTAHFLVGGMTGKNHRASLQERYRVMCRHYGTVQTVIMHLWFAVKGLTRLLKRKLKR